MRLTEYITRLQEIQNVHGDLEVYWLSDEQDMLLPLGAEPTVEMLDEEEGIRVVCIN